MLNAMNKLLYVVVQVDFLDNYFYIISFQVFKLFKGLNHGRI